MTIRQRTVAAILLSILSGCAPNIKPPTEANVGSRTPLASFQTIALLPMTTNHSDGDAGDVAAIQRIEDQLAACLKNTFPLLERTGPDAPHPPGTLVIAPRIEDISKKTSFERVMLGPIGGASAVLLRVSYSRSDDQSVLASPVFYAKAAGWGGAFSMGTTDNLIMRRVVHQACDYARANK